jgi:hypothetical protein
MTTQHDEAESQALAADGPVAEPAALLSRPFLDRDQLATLKAGGMKVGERLFFMAWLTSSDAKGYNRCDQETGAARAGVSRATASRAINRAIEKKWIEEVAPAGPGRAAAYDTSAFMRIRGNGGSFVKKRERTEVAPDLKAFVDDVSGLASLLDGGRPTGRARGWYTQALKKVAAEHRPLLLADFKAKVVDAVRAGDAFDGVKFCAYWTAAGSKPALRKGDKVRAQASRSGMPVTEDEAAADGVTWATREAAAEAPANHMLAQVAEVLRKAVSPKLLADLKPFDYLSGAAIAANDDVSTLARRALTHGTRTNTPGKREQIEHAMSLVEMEMV